MGLRMETSPRSDQARRDMLKEIRAHLDASPLVTSSASPRADVSAPAETTLSSAPTTEALVEQFRQALAGVAGQCVVVRDLAGAADAVNAVLAARRPRRVTVSDAPLVRQVMAAVMTDAEVVPSADPETLFSSDVGITSAQWAAAETATLVLESDAERHRLASLIPPVHVALIAADCIRPTIGHVIADLAGREPGALSRCVTFITGPSRTSDIELTLAIGVHGPGELHVIVVERADGRSTGSS